jgi:hypothetical protein
MMTRVSVGLARTGWAKTAADMTCVLPVERISRGGEVVTRPTPWPRGLGHRIGIIRCSYGVPAHITYGFDVSGSAPFG